MSVVGFIPLRLGSRLRQSLVHLVPIAGRRPFKFIIVALHCGLFQCPLAVLWLGNGFPLESGFYRRHHCDTVVREGIGVPVLLLLLVISDPY
jgi:hypothetical protein